MTLTTSSVLKNASGKGIIQPCDPSQGAQVAGFDPTVVFNHKKIDGTVLADGLTLTDACEGVGGGVLIPATPDKSNLGMLKEDETFFFSNHFSGGDFTVLKDPEGRWAAAHVHDSDSCRNGIAALPKGWEVVYTWCSRPYAKRYGPTGSIALCCFITATKLKFVMLRLTGDPATVKDAVLSASVDI